MEGIYSFTSQLHSHPSPPIDPSNAHLPNLFAVCVIGASRNIGAAIATSYAKAGAGTLILAARSTDDLQGVVKRIEEISPTCKVHVFHCDIAENESVAKLAKSIKEQVGRLDVVVANSGSSGEFILKVTEGDPVNFQKTINTNLIGTYHAAHHLLPLLLSTPGGSKQFVAVGSLNAWMTTGPVASIEYSVSKLGQARIVEMIAEQFKDEGLLAVTVHPGAVPTETALGLTPKVMHPSTFVPLKQRSIFFKLLIRLSDICLPL